MSSTDELRKRASKSKPDLGFMQPSVALHWTAHQVNVIIVLLELTKQSQQHECVLYTRMYGTCPYQTKRMTLRTVGNSRQEQSFIKWRNMFAYK